MSWHGAEWRTWALAGGSLAAGLLLGRALERRPRSSLPEAAEAAPEPQRAQPPSNICADAPGRAELRALFMQLAPRPLQSRGLTSTAPGSISAAAPHSSVRAVFVVASGKGGVGKSTTCVNLAFALKQLGLKVGLLDLDVYGPSLPELIPMTDCSVMGTPGPDGKQVMIPLEYGGVQMMSIGYIMQGQAAAIRAPIATGMVVQLLTEVRWGDIDCLIVDTPPGTGDVLLTITQNLQIDGAVLMTTANAVSVADLMKGAQLFDKVQVPTLAVCQNMAAIPCEQCGHDNELFADSAAAQLPALVESLSVKLLRVPLDTNLSRAPAECWPAERRKYPYVENPDFRDRPASRALRCLAEALLAAFLTAHSQGSKRTTLRLRPGGLLELRLPGGEVHPVPCGELRASCRCAECINEVTGEPQLDRERILSDTALKALSVEPVGNYGAQLRWSDGHSSLVSLRATEQLFCSSLGPAAPGTKGSSNW